MTVRAPRYGCSKVCKGGSWSTTGLLAYSKHRAEAASHLLHFPSWPGHLLHFPSWPGHGPTFSTFLHGPATVVPWLFTVNSKHRASAALPLPSPLPFMALPWSLLAFSLLNSKTRALVSFLVNACMLRASAAHTQACGIRADSPVKKGAAAN